MFINRGSWHILVHVVGSKLRDTEDYDDNDDGDAGSYPIIKSFMAHITSQFPAWIGTGEKSGYALFSDWMLPTKLRVND